MPELLPCDVCGRPSKNRRPLYVSESLSGIYGRQCFYKVARGLWTAGFMPRHANGRMVLLRRGGQ